MTPDASNSLDTKSTCSNTGGKSKRRQQTAHGKFARWKERVLKAFDNIDEEAVHYMYFELHGDGAHVSVRQGRYPNVKKGE